MAISRYDSPGAAAIHGSSTTNAWGTGINDAVDASGFVHASPNEDSPILYLNTPHEVDKFGGSTNEVASGINNSIQAVGTAFGKTSRAFIHAGQKIHLVESHRRSVDR